MRIEKGLVVFMTGGASGLGEATARYLHARGASIACADVNADNMKALGDDLKERFWWIKCDVTSEE